MKMIYKGVPIDLRSGDIILFRNNFIWYRPMTYLSAAVRFFTRCYYNHAAIVVLNWEQIEINEAVAEGVIGRPASKHLRRPHTEIKVLRSRNAVVERDICIRANSAKGAGYDFKNLLFEQVVYRTFGKWLGGSGTQEEDRMVCSEYVGWCYGLDRWWLLSSKELEVHPGFFPAYVEKTV